ASPWGRYGDVRMSCGGRASARTPTSSFFRCGSATATLRDNLSTSAGFAALPMGDYPPLLYRHCVAASVAGAHHWQRRVRCRDLPGPGRCAVRRVPTGPLPPPRDDWSLLWGLGGSGMAYVPYWDTWGAVGAVAATQTGD